MKTAVFLGPSLRQRDARQLLEATYFPPIKRDDLAGMTDWDVIVIIDGQFGQSLAVTPKEILNLLDQGVRVVGASSMGALRAAELDSFGMEGIGWVFNRFKQTWIRQEDEVALSYAPHDLSALTVPLVDIAHWMETLSHADLVTKAEAAAIFRALKRVFFAERTPSKVYDALAKAVGDDRAAAIRAEADIPDIKGADARAALTHVACMMSTEHNDIEMTV